MKKMTISRMLLSVLFLSVLLADARAEDVYQHPPSYDRQAQLEDIWSVAEVVVVGTADKRTIQVGKTLFGKTKDLTEANSVLSLGMGPKPHPTEQGVWFLVKAPNGYAVLNPRCRPIPIPEFKKLSQPENHWASQANLVVNRPSKVQVYHSYTRPNTKDTVAHGTDVYGYTDGDLRVELKLHGRRQMWLMISSAGIHERIAKYPEEGHGFYLEYDNGNVLEFFHFKDRKKHGLYRRYFKSNPDQLREEKHFTDGIIDGQWREWDEEGTLVRDDLFSLGFILPIVRYKGKGTSGVTLHRSESGVTYSTAAVVRDVKAGMTSEEVSELLKVDFSPAQGLMFPSFMVDQYLFIGFKDGKVSEIRTGHNGVCIDFSP